MTCNHTIFFTISPTKMQQGTKNMIFQYTTKLHQKTNQAINMLEVCCDPYKCQLCKYIFIYPSIAGIDTQ